MKEIDQIIKEFVSENPDFRLFYKRDHDGKYVLVFKNDEKEKYAGLVIDHKNGVVAASDGEGNSNIINKVEGENFTDLIHRCFTTNEAKEEDRELSNGIYRGYSWKISLENNQTKLSIRDDEDQPVNFDEEKFGPASGDTEENLMKRAVEVIDFDIKAIEGHQKEEYGDFDRFDECCEEDIKIVDVVRKQNENPEREEWGKDIVEVVVATDEKFADDVEKFDKHNKENGNCIAKFIYSKVQIVPVEETIEERNGKTVLVFKYDMNDYDNCVKEFIESLSAKKIDESAKKSIFNIDGSFHVAFYNMHNNQIEIAIARKIPFGSYDINGDNELMKYFDKVVKFISDLLGLEMIDNFDSYLISDSDGMFQNFTATIYEDDAEALSKYEEALKEAEFINAESDINTFEKFNA